MCVICCKYMITNVIVACHSRTRNDYSFDDKIANVVGCDVHSFDPG